MYKYIYKNEQIKIIRKHHIPKGLYLIFTARAARAWSKTPNAEQGIQNRQLSRSFRSWEKQKEDEEKCRWNQNTSSSNKLHHHSWISSKGCKEDGMWKTGRNQSDFSERWKVTPSTTFHSCLLLCKTAHMMTVWPKRCGLRMRVPSSRSGGCTATARKETDRRRTHSSIDTHTVSMGMKKKQKGKEKKKKEGFKQVILHHQPDEDYGCAQFKQRAPRIIHPVLWHMPKKPAGQTRGLRAAHIELAAVTFMSKVIRRGFFLFSLVVSLSIYLSLRYRSTYKHIYIYINMYISISITININI